jgi:hypothetical protein
MKKQLSALLLGVSLLSAPLATSAFAEQATAPQGSYQVALFGHHHAMATGVKKHHRLRNTALVIGGALTAKHMMRKHREHRAAGY